MESKITKTIETKRVFDYSQDDIEELILKQLNLQEGLTTSVHWTASQCPHLIIDTITKEVIK